ncbi:putative nucleotidyltransferase/DNA-binding transcriptional ArsR family regulator [Methanomicrobium sp. W14]|uniref:nucleotidyltransferase domain-containing protein n=1 Tax=Methanomicrobium sp. W14 TaxID=2817839 RepID=UPI001AE2E8BF|nr:nucleotidyltransferase domain-containing protein [Methanomicrobium sp. W14]MBP2133297.1 putative nucleotidyltransferase/DNA-binding transcriptional ArsR family regulator [Methanomicrobium sp. W14]
MSKILDITENHLKILSLYTNGYDSDYYIREICRHVPVSHGAAQNILNSLEEKGVLYSEIRGRLRVFKLRNTPAAKNHILLAESYKRLKFSEKYPFANRIIYRVLPAFSCPLALFGSYSSGLAEEHSDIDLLCVGDFDLPLVEKISKMFRTEINVKKYNQEVFKEGLHDHLLKEVYKNHVYLKCPEFFVEWGLEI